MNIIIKTAEWNKIDENKFINEASQLVYEANPEFYDLISPNKKDILDNLVLQLQDEYSELGYSIISIFDDIFCGISVYYPNAEMKQRQLISLKHLMGVKSRYPDFIDRIKSFASKVEQIPHGRAMYLARIGVTKDYRRQGIASMLNNAMDYDVRHKGYTEIFSQSCRDNAPSIRMHLERGYSRISDKDYLFITMQKKID